MELGQPGWTPPNTTVAMTAQHQQLLSDKIDVAAWFSDFIEAGAPLGHPPR